MEMTELIASVVDKLAVDADEYGGLKLPTSSTESYHPLFAGPPESSSRVTRADTRVPSPVALALYKALCDVAAQVAQYIGPSRFSTIGSNSFLDDLIDIANYERELTGAAGDVDIPVPSALRAGSSQAARLQAVLDHLTETFVRFIMPVVSTPGLLTDNETSEWYVNLAKARRAAREASVMVLRHLAGADRVGPVVPAITVGSSRPVGSRLNSGGGANEDLVRQTVQAIQQAANTGPNAGIF